MKKRIFTVFMSVVLTLFVAGCGDDEVKHNLALNVGEAGSGWVSNVSGSHKEGTTVSATAFAGWGYEFVHWLLGEDVYSEESTIRITMNSAITLTAVFEWTGIVELIGSHWTSAATGALWYQVYVDSYGSYMEIFEQNPLKARIFLTESDGDNDIWPNAGLGVFFDASNLFTVESVDIDYISDKPFRFGLPTTLTHTDVEATYWASIPASSARRTQSIGASSFRGEEWMVNPGWNGTISEKSYDEVSLQDRKSGVLFTLAADVYNDDVTIEVFSLRLKLSAH